MIANITCIYEIYNKNKRYKGTLLFCEVLFKTLVLIRTYLLTL